MKTGDSLINEAEEKTEVECEVFSSWVTKTCFVYQFLFISNLVYVNEECFKVNFMEI